MVNHRLLEYLAAIVVGQPNLWAIFRNAGFFSGELGMALARTRALEEKKI